MEEELYISWLGLAAAGKTTLIKRLIEGIFIENLPPTVGVNMDQLPHPNGDTTFVNWDIGGQVQYRDELWKPYISKSAGCTFVIDSTDRERIPAVKEAFWQKLVPELNQLKIPLIILVNKQDLSSPMTAGEIARMLKLHELEKGISYNILPTSAKTGSGLDQALDWLIQIIDEAKVKKHGEKLDSFYDDLLETG